MSAADQILKNAASRRIIEAELFEMLRRDEIGIEDKRAIESILTAAAAPLFREAKAQMDAAEANPTTHLVDEEDLSDCVTLLDADTEARR